MSWERGPQSIRNDIARTRFEMSRTLDELRRKLVPEEKYQDALRTGRSLVAGAARSLKSNPVPVMMAGAGIAWFVAQGLLESAKVRACGCAPDADCPHGESTTQAESASAGERVKSGAKALGGRVKAGAQDLGDRMKSRARSLGHQAKERASDVGHRAAGFYEDNPLVTGAIALAAGLAAALAVPPTRIERELLGAKGAELLDRGEEIGRKAAETAVDEASKPSQAEEASRPPA